MAPATSRQEGVGLKPLAAPAGAARARAVVRHSIMNTRTWTAVGTVSTGTGGAPALSMGFAGLLAVACTVAAADPAAAVAPGASAVLKLETPVDYQVFQRESATRGRVRVRGHVPAGADRFEVELGGERRPVEFGKEDGAFDVAWPVAAGGWYVCRAWASRAGTVVATAEVPHVGVGEVFVVAGQSNSANHGAERQQPKTGRVSACAGAVWRVADDPQPGASGDGGSFLPPLGDEIARRFGVPVGLVACGIGATSVREWLPEGARFPNPPTLTGRVRPAPGGGWESKGEAYAGLVARLKALGPRGFRAVLWHQGESDANQADPTRTLPGTLYRESLARVIGDSRRAIGWDAPWFVALVSYHVPGDEASPDIRAAQRSLWESGVALEGPDSDALKGVLRENNGQGVHFSGEGLRQHAARWADKVAPWLESQLKADAGGPAPATSR